MLSRNMGGTITAERRYVIGELKKIYNEAESDDIKAQVDLFSFISLIMLKKRLVKLIDSLYHRKMSSLHISLLPALHSVGDLCGEQIIKKGDIRFFLASMHWSLTYREKSFFKTRGQFTHLPFFGLKRERLSFF